MKTVILVLFTVIFFSSCETFFDFEAEKQIEEQTINIYSKELNDYPRVIQEIFVSDQGLIRGLNLGLTEEEVRGLEREKFSQSDKEIEFLLVELELSDDVHLDIEYHFDRLHLKKFVFVIYTTGEEQQEFVFDKMTEYITERFHLDPELSKWMIGNSVFLSLKKVGNDKEFDIELLCEEL